MHGIIHAEIRRYIEHRHGREAWHEALQKAGLEGRIYTTVGTYPDEQLMAIVDAAVSMTGTPVNEILEDFGEFLAPSLLSMYRALIRPEWKTAELLLHTEATIHTVVRMKNPGAEPPHLRFESTGPDSLVFFYNSPRRLADVARGIIRGVADHYGETVIIDEDRNEDGTSRMNIQIKPRS